MERPRLAVIENLQRRMISFAKCGDLLGDLVFVNLEIFGLQPIHVLALLVSYGVAEHDHVHLYVEGSLVLGAQPENGNQSNDGYGSDNS